jgi:glycosyltransferase involved in cell wall biosynthesis
MKILRIIADSNPQSGGPIEGARRFASVWAGQGHQQDLLTLDGPGEHFLDDYPGEIIGLGPARSKRVLDRYRYAPRMVPWLRENASKYDAILISGLWRYFALGAKIALASGPTPYFVLTHGMLDPWFRKKYPLKHWGKQLSWLFAEGPLVEGARNVLFTTEEEMLLAHNSFWPYRARGAVIGYGTQDVYGDAAVQEEAFRTLLPRLGSRPYLLFLSRIHPKKGCDLLVKAFATIAHQHPDIDLVIAGPDQSALVDGLRAIAEDHGVAVRLHFPGMLKGDEKIGAFRGARAFILPSHQENFGIVVAEAMACSKPVLISNKVNIWREIEADDAGIVANDDLDGTIALIKNFLALDDSRVMKMGRNARGSFLKRFHVENAATNLIELINSRIEEPVT